MANNRELSQFASFVSVDDTSDSISFASTITSVNVSGASTIGNVVIGAATTDIVVTGDLNVTGVISATQFGGEAVINTDRIIQVGGGTSITRAANLQAELDKLGKKNYRSWCCSHNSTRIRRILLYLTTQTAWRRNWNYHSRILNFRNKTRRYWKPLL